MREVMLVGGGGEDRKKERSSATLGGDELASCTTWETTQPLFQSHTCTILDHADMK